MVSENDGGQNKTTKGEAARAALREALESDAREMLRASGKDPEDPELLRKLLSGSLDPMERLLYTRVEAAELMQVSLRTYIRMHERGEGPPEIEFTPDVVRISRRSLEEYLTRRDMEAAEKLKAKALEVAKGAGATSSSTRAARNVGAAIGAGVRKRRKNRPSMEPPEPKKRKPTLRAVVTTTKKRS